MILSFYAKCVLILSRCGSGLKWGLDPAEGQTQLFTCAPSLSRWECDFPHWPQFKHCFCINGQQSRSICLQDLPLSSRRTSQARRWCLLLVLSRRTIRATKVIIKLRIIHTCYHCMGCWAFFCFVFLAEPPSFYLAIYRRVCFIVCLPE